MEAADALTWNAAPAAFTDGHVSRRRLEHFLPVHCSSSSSIFRSICIFGSFSISLAMSPSQSPLSGNAAGTLAGRAAFSTFPGLVSLSALWLSPWLARERPSPEVV